MKLTKLLLILITGLAIMGFSTTGFAWVDTPDIYVEELFEPDEREYTVEPEIEGELMIEEFAAETGSMEEEYLVDEETVKPVKGEGFDEHEIPELY